MRLQQFRVPLQSSLLSNPDVWPSINDKLAELHYDQSTHVLNKLIPSWTVTCRRRSSYFWFDQDCRSAKRVVRQLERAARRAEPSAAAIATAAWYVACQSYMDLRRRKRESFWPEKVEHERASPAQLWRSADALMGHGRFPITDAIGPNDLHAFFDAKVATVQPATVDALPPTFTPAPSGCSFLQFQSVRIGDVITAFRALPDKQCLSNPLTTRLLKGNADVLAPFITVQLNRLLSSGSVQLTFKDAYITPLLKKASMDPADVRSHRPISNLSVMSKLRASRCKALGGVLVVIWAASDSPVGVSCTPLNRDRGVEGTFDILQAIDAGHLAVLALLGLSAAFDTVDHVTLLQHLKTSYSLDGTVLKWISLYLNDRTQFVRCGASTSTRTHVACRVPHGSVLGLVLFLLYTAVRQRAPTSPIC